MGCTAFDYWSLQSEFSTYEMRKIWDEENIIRNWLRVEGAVAKAQGMMAIIPPEAAVEIYEKTSSQKVDPVKVKENIKKSGHLVVGLIRTLQEVVSERAKEFIHFGISSADVLDTGLILVLRQAYEIIERDTKEVMLLLANLSEEHKETPMAGRTHGQHANPITFGFKTAVWLSEIGRHLERLNACRTRLLVGNISGAVGTGISFGEAGKELQKRVLDELELAEPTIVSHMLQRDRLAEFTQTLGSMGTTLGKIGHEIFTLQRPEIAELSEPFEEGIQVGSTAMPHKRNPFRSEASWGMARLIRVLSLSMTEAQIMENENDISMLSSSYISVPLCCLLSSRLLHDFKFMLPKLQVNVRRMHANLYITAGLNCSENIMMKMAPIIGREKAHALIYQIAMESYRSGKSFVALLLENKEVLKHFTEKAIQECVEPSKSTGTASSQVEKVLQEWREKNRTNGNQG